MAERKEDKVDKLLRGCQFRNMLDEQWEGLRKKYGLKKAQIDVLLFLEKSGSSDTARDIQTFLGMNKGYLSQILDSLCRLGYLNSSTDRADRRFVHYELTDSAKAIAAEASEIRAKIYKRLYSGLSPEDVEHLKGICDTLDMNIQDILKNGL